MKPSRFLLMLLASQLPCMVHGVTLTFFPASAWSPDAATLNQNLGLTHGYASANWQPVTAEVQDAGGTRSVTLPVDAAPAGNYFRLR